MPIQRRFAQSVTHYFQWKKLKHIIRHIIRTGRQKWNELVCFEIFCRFLFFNTVKCLHKVKPRLSTESEPSIESEETVENDHDNADDDSEDDENDLITLSGCRQVTQWRFPNTKSCPVISCRVLFGIRSDAIRHYKKRHAQTSILCPACKRPIVAQFPNQFLKHFTNIHPNTAIPFDFGTLVAAKVRAVCILQYFVWYSMVIDILLFVDYFKFNSHRRRQENGTNSAKHDAQILRPNRRQIMTHQMMRWMMWLHWKDATKSRSGDFQSTLQIALL